MENNVEKAKEIVKKLIGEIRDAKQIKSIKLLPDDALTLMKALSPTDVYKQITDQIRFEIKEKLEKMVDSKSTDELAKTVSEICFEFINSLFMIFEYILADAIAMQEANRIIQMIIDKGQTDNLDKMQPINEKPF